jgi:hypothetical protein
LSTLRREEGPTKTVIAFFNLFGGCKSVGLTEIQQVNCQAQFERKQALENRNARIL